MTLADWLEAWSALARLYEAKQYAEGERYAAHMRVQFPERATQAAFFEACFLGVQGNGDGALNVLEKIVESGSWVAPAQLRDSDLDVARGPRLDALASEMQRRYEGMLQQAREVAPNVEIVRPSTAPRGVLVALHMYTASARDTARLWAPAATHGFLVLAPESTQRDADGLPAWLDDDVSLKDARAALESVEGPPSPLILGGASQGARTATRFALEGTMPAAGFISIVSHAPEVDAQAYDRARDAGVRAWILTGERDGIRPVTEAFHRDLVARGFDARLEVAPDTAHDYPEDFPERLARALEFLTA